jgi:Flp pilus assembly protein TadD
MRVPTLSAALEWPTGGWLLAVVCFFGLFCGGGFNGSRAGGSELVPFRDGAPSDLLSKETFLDTGRLQVHGGVSEGDEAWASSELRESAAAMGRGETASARAGFKRVLERQPENLVALVNLGWIAQREKSWTEAESYLRRAQRLAPENSAVWMALGISVLEQGSLEHALGAFAQVIAFEPNNARGHRLLAMTLARKGWYSAAEEELRRALEIEPDDAGAHFNLAVLYLQRHPCAVELARRHYFRAIDMGVAPDSAVEEILAESVKTSGISKATGDAPRTVR